MHVSDERKAGSCLLRRRRELFERAGRSRPSGPLPSCAHDRAWTSRQSGSVRAIARRPSSVDLDVASAAVLAGAARHQAAILERAQLARQRWCGPSPSSPASSVTSPSRGGRWRRAAGTASRAGRWAAALRRSGASAPATSRAWPAPHTRTRPPRGRRGRDDGAGRGMVHVYIHLVAAEAPPDPHAAPVVRWCSTTSARISSRLSARATSRSASGSARCRGRGAACPRSPPRRPRRRARATISEVEPVSSRTCSASSRIVISSCDADVEDLARRRPRAPSGRSSARTDVGDVAEAAAAACRRRRR